MLIMILRQQKVTHPELCVMKLVILDFIASIFFFLGNCIDMSPCFSLNFLLGSLQLSF